MHPVFHAKGRQGEDLLSLDTYHVSYFRRRWPAERAFHTCNLRKSYGFHLVIAFAINDVTSFEWTDDHPLTGGRLGLRQMAPLIGDYANLRVSRS